MLTPQSSPCAWLVLWHCDLRSGPKNTWTWVMLCHFQKWLTRGSTCILHCCCCLLSHVWLWDSMDGGSSGSSIHGILQARMLDCLAISFSRGSSQPRNRTHVSCLGRWVLTHWAIVASSDQKHWHHLKGFWKYGLAGCTQIFWVRSCSTNRIPGWQVSTLALTSTDALRPGRVCVFTLLTTLWVWADHITSISPRIFTCKMWKRAVTKLNIAAWSLAWWRAREESVNVSSVLPWLLRYGLTMYL